MLLKQAKQPLSGEKFHKAAEKRFVYAIQLERQIL
jgi:hypothetical protein